MLNKVVNISARTILERHGFPEMLLDSWEQRGIRELLPIQARALATGILGSKSCLVVGPTTCGKTFVGELVCVKLALEGRRSIYLVPFKAIAEEKYIEFRNKYSGDSIGANIICSTGDRRSQDRSLVEGDFTIAVLTYEKLSTLLVAQPGILKDAGALVVDEVQMLCDSGRGGELELLLTRARQIAPNLQIVGLSAVVSELNGFDKWLNAEVIADDHRPVVLREGVISPDGTFEFMEWIGASKTSGREKLPTIVGSNQQELTVSAARQILQNPNEQLLVFVSTVKNTQTVAQSITAAIGSSSPARKALEELARLEPSGGLSALNQTLQRGIAFHNGDMTFEERLIIEQGFRNGEVKCIVSTSTLSMGVNLPCSTVLIVQPTKWTRGTAGWEETNLTVAEYRNMSGRAGRFGLATDKYGRSILISRSPMERHSYFSRFVQGSVEPIRSVLADMRLDTAILLSPTLPME